MKISKELQGKYISAAIILLAIGATVLIFYFKSWRGLGNPAASPNATPEIVLAPKGSLTDGFPSELVLDKSAAIEESYSTNYDTGVSQKTAVFNSDKSTHDLFVLSRDYFVKAGWKLTNMETDSKGNTIVFNARKGEDELNIAINKQDNKSQLTVSYLAKNK